MQIYFRINCVFSLELVLSEEISVNYSNTLKDIFNRISYRIHLFQFDYIFQLRPPRRQNVSLQQRKVEDGVDAASTSPDCEHFKYLLFVGTSIWWTTSRKIWIQNMLLTCVVRSHSFILTNLNIAYSWQLLLLVVDLKLNIVK